MAQWFKVLHGYSEYVEENSDADCEYHGFHARLHKPQYNEM